MDKYPLLLWATGLWVEPCHPSKSTARAVAAYLQDQTCEGMCRQHGGPQKDGVLRIEPYENATPVQPAHRGGGFINAIALAPKTPQRDPISGRS